MKIDKQEIIEELMDEKKGFRKFRCGNEIFRL